MGRRISKEFLHPSILEGVNNKIGNLDSLETDAKGNMVQAINELVEKLDNSAEIENGKELIANAVGEPLTAEDSFEEMRNDINGLLSTFKTNMMNNGVAVESGDKFKSLIDKIATMVEEGSNKGIKFASGTCDVTTNVGGSTTITTNLDFVPTYIFCYALVRRYRGQYNNVDGSLPNLYISNISSMPSTSGYPVSVSNITANDFRVSGGVYNSVEEYKTSVNVTKWYAIGIGEEDTTLRDSLASILQEEGVNVTEEDDMASLINKVDEEFDNQVVPAGTAVASDVISGKTFINSTGKTVTGTATISSLGGMQFASGNVDLSWDSENGSQTYTISGLTFTPKHFIICFSNLFLYERNGVNATFRNVHLFDNTRVSDSSGETYVYISNFSKTGFTIRGYHYEPSYGTENKSEGTIVAWYAFG